MVVKFVADSRNITVLGPEYSGAAQHMFIACAFSLKKCQTFQPLPPRKFLLIRLKMGATLPHGLRICEGGCSNRALRP